MDEGYKLFETHMFDSMFLPFVGQVLRSKAA